MSVEYKLNYPISAQQFITLLKQTTLGERRPTDNIETIQGMIDNSNLMVTAWIEDELIGIARSVTDFHYCCYLSDLAVSENAQTSGVGKQLIIETFKQLKEGCKLNLLSAPQAVDYYPYIGLEKHNSAWTLSNLNQLK